MARKKIKRRPVYRQRRNTLVATATKNLIGIGMIGATASMTNALPTGTAKTITGIVPGLQAISLVGENLKVGRQRKIVKQLKGGKNGK